MKYSRRLIQLPLLAAAAVLALAETTSAQLVTRFEVQTPVISPDGNGRLDSTRVRYTLADSAVAVSVVVFAADSVTPVYTLRASAPGSAGTYDAYWRGQRDGGAPAGEGAYVVTLQAFGHTEPDVVSSLPVFVDVTPPFVQILSVTPNPYAPGLSTARPALEVALIVSSTSPLSSGRAPDRLGVAFANPGGAPVAATVVTTPPFAGADGEYVSAWDASASAASLSDGEYRVDVTVDDAAGYTARASYHFEIDSAAPTVTITSPPDNARVRVVPDSLRGRAFDRHGVDSLYVKYPSSPYQRVTRTSFQNDSLLFAIPLSDSVQSEGTYNLSFRAVDKAGRSLVHPSALIYDATAPAAPVLDAFNGAWQTVSYPLSGSVDNAGDTSTLVRVERNGAVVDSVPSALSSRFTLNIPLLVGRNELVAYQRDGAGNLSGASNPVVVTFASNGGLFFPVPFAPGGTFQVNAARVARSATLRVFDVTGDLVTLFEDGSARQYYAFNWNGRNSSDHPVRRGPLVAIAAVQYEDGTREIYREVFLFDSNP